jgi:DNA-binding SARP family transcriptional activator
VHVEFRVLGPLEVSVNGRVNRVKSAMPRALLAALLAGNGEPLSKSELFDELWDDVPPKGPDNALYRLVARLRKILDACAPGARLSDRLVTRSAGYALEIEPDELDANRFTALVAEARQVAPDDPIRARALFDKGLALWRGRAMQDVTGGRISRAAASRLDEERLAAIEERVDAGMAAGLCVEVISEVKELIILHPWRERFYEQLMVALYRSGRQGESIEVYHRLRERLSDELGLEPSSSVRKHMHAILKQDASLLITP